MRELLQHVLDMGSSWRSRDHRQSSHSDWLPHRSSATGPRILPSIVRSIWPRVPQSSPYNV